MRDVARIFIPPEWVERINKIDNVRILQLEESTIKDMLSVNNIFPIRDEFEIMQLKKKKVILQCRINLLFKRNHNKMKELL